MYNIAGEMQQGFNNLIRDQKELDGEATITLVQFNSSYELTHDMIAIDEVPNFILRPSGCTALLDGMGYTMNLVRGQIAEMSPDDRPARCIFIVITDGEENSSRSYNRDVVFEMIEDCNNSEEVNYEFVFLGANQDAIQAGGNIGVRADASMTYDATSQGTRVMYQSLSKGLTTYRGTSSKNADFSFNSDAREKAKDDIAGAIAPNVPSYFVDDTTTK
jgi:uncharacterized protein YegL